MDKLAELRQDFANGRISQRDTDLNLSCYVRVLTGIDLEVLLAKQAHTVISLNIYK